MSFDGFCVEIRCSFQSVPLFPFRIEEILQQPTQQRATRVNVISTEKKRYKHGASFAPDCSPDSTCSSRQLGSHNPPRRKTVSLFRCEEWNRNSSPFRNGRHHLLCLCSLLVDDLHSKASTGVLARISSFRIFLQRAQIVFPRKPKRFFIYLYWTQSALFTCGIGKRNHDWLHSREERSKAKSSASTNNWAHKIAIPSNGKYLLNKS